MLSLLKVEFKTLFKFKPTKWLLIAFVVLAILLSYMSVLNEEISMTSLFNGLFIINLVVVAVSGVFLYNDFSQNTLRNKIAVGHKRFDVYCSKFIVILVFYLLCTIVYAVPSFVINYFGLDTDGIVWEALGKNLFLVLLTILINTAITICLTMSIRGIVGAVLPFITAEGTSIAGTIALELLSISDNTKPMEFIQAIPNIQIMIMSPQVVPENIGISITIAIVTSVALLALGYLSFRKADLN